MSDSGAWYPKEDEVGFALRSAVGDYGARSLSSPQVLGNLLSDLLPDAPREASLLLQAAEVDVPATLARHLGANMDPDTAVRLTASALGEARPLAPEACLWVTRQFAHALGYQVAMPTGPVQMTSGPTVPSPPPGTTPPGAVPPGQPPAPPPPPPVPQGPSSAETVNQPWPGSAPTGSWGAPGPGGGWGPPGTPAASPGGPPGPPQAGQAPQAGPAGAPGPPSAGAPGGWGAQPGQTTPQSAPPPGTWSGGQTAAAPGWGAGGPPPQQGGWPPPGGPSQPGGWGPGGAVGPAPPKKRAGTKVAVAIAAVVGVVVVYLIVAAAASIAPFGSSTSTTAAVPPTSPSSSTDSTTTSSTDDTTTTSPNADPQAYLAAIHTQPHFDGLSDSILTTLGNGVCQDFSDGHDLTFVESDALNAVNKINANDAESGNNPGGNLTAEDAGFLIGAAVKGLCPQYTDQLPSS